MYTRACVCLLGQTMKKSVHNEPVFIATKRNYQITLHKNTFNIQQIQYKKH